MEIDHIDSILDVDEHSNPRFTCSVKPDYRDHWRYETNDDKLPRTVVRTSDRTETNGDIYMYGDKPQRAFVRTSDRTETNGDRIAREWAKFMETATPEEKVKALTEIIRTLVPGTSV